MNNIEDRDRNTWEDAKKALTARPDHTAQFFDIGGLLLSMTLNDLRELMRSPVRLQIIGVSRKEASKVRDALIKKIKEEYPDNKKPTNRQVEEALSYKHKGS